MWLFWELLCSLWKESHRAPPCWLSILRCSQILRLLWTTHADEHEPTLSSEWFFRKPSPFVFAERGLSGSDADAVNDVNADDADSCPKQPID
jgi:hypothetical protein